MFDGFDDAGFGTEYLRHKENVEKYLYQVVPSFEIGGQKQLGEAIRYSLEAGGKRIRPVLALATCDLLGGDTDLAMPFAAAIELIHTYSLIHDDMPCMDDDDYRRGKPTCHRVYGEDMALLAGDSALNLAFEIMLEESLKYVDDAGIASRGLTAQGVHCSVLKAMEYIARASGCRGMAGGQAIDLSGTITNIDELKNLHSHKTGSLISAAVVSAAILCECEGDEFLALERYSDLIGLAFQVKDDILDKSGDFGKMGKEPGRDERKEKLTFVSLLGLDGAEGFLSELVGMAVESIAVFGGGAVFLESMARYIASRSA